MSEGSPLVSVIVPAFRSMDKLGVCLEALVRQDGVAGRYEVIVVDNGGNPGIGSLIRQWPGVRVVQEPNPGSYSARNRGIRAACGELLAFTDADCRPDRRWIAAGVQALTGNCRIGLVGGAVELTTANGAANRVSAVELYERHTAFPQSLYIERFHFAVTANMFTRRAVVQEVGAFDETLRSGGDNEFGRRVFAAGHQVHYAPQAIVRHPARRSLGQLVRKTRRVVGGDMSLWRMGRRRYSARELGNFIVPPLLWSVRLLRDEDGAGTLAAKLRIIAIRHVLHFVALGERLRLLAGGEPCR